MKVGEFKFTTERKMRFMVRILSKVQIEPVNECWIWTGQRNKHTGYGYITIRMPGRKNPTAVLVHRIAYQVFRRALPRGREAAHSHRCVSKLCCNPWHIRGTSHSANERDKKKAVLWKRKNFREMWPPTHCDVV